jgi:hypothetical protein
MDRRIAALLCLVLALPAYAVGQDMIGKGKTFYATPYVIILSIKRLQFCASSE